MGVYGILKSILRLSLEGLILMLLITFIPGLPPDVKISEPYKLTKGSVDGKLSFNNKLDSVEFLHKDELHGPESFTDDGFLYTSLHSGEIVKLVGKQIVPIVKFGKPCKGVYEEKICGRPLGLRFGSDGYLYAADAYYGIFKVDVKTGDKENIVSFEQEIEGKKTRLPNSVAIACNGDVYWTDSSTDFLMQDVIFAVLADPTGRLIHYNARTGVNKVLMKNMGFPNGVILSPNGDFLLVVESNRNRVWKYHLDGTKKGTHEIFIDGLPGHPDNIQSDGSSGYLVTLIMESHTKYPGFLQIFSQFPNIRKFFARSLGLAELAFKGIERIYPNEYSQKGIHAVGHLGPASSLLSSKSAVIHVSEKGEILDTLWTSNKTIGRFSDAYIMKDQLYIGSPYNKYVGRIPLSKLGWEHLKQKTDSAKAAKQRCINKSGGEVPSKQMKPEIKAETNPGATTPTSSTPTTTTSAPTPKPVREVPKPATATPKPPVTTPKPTVATSKPAAATPKPATATPKPATNTPKPDTATPKSAAATPKPPAPTPKPAAASYKPASETPKPAAATPKPAAATPKPAVATPKHVVNTPKPAVPATGTPTPTASTPVGSSRASQTGSKPETMGNMHKQKSVQGEQEKKRQPTIEKTAPRVEQREVPKVSTSTQDKAESPPKPAQLKSQKNEL